SSKSVVNLTFWSWVPNIGASVTLWNQSHPGIQVHLDETAGGSAGTYAKMFSALQAGNAPDLGQIEYDVLPNFEHVGGLSDISSYVKAYKSDFLGWTWNQVSLGSAVYAVPQDTGPMGLFYRADLFKKYGLTVPTTWQGFFADAQKLHAADPNLYLATFSPADTGWFTGLEWQAGANWFSTSGNSWLVNLTSSASQKVASLWQEMISQHLVKVEPDFTSGWNKDFANGTVLTWPGAVWGENGFPTDAANTAGDWRVAPLPNWGSTPSDGNFGGSTTAVFKDSKHPKQAAEFAAWLNTNQQSITTLITKGGLYPADIQGESQPVLNSPVAFYGGQNIWKVFSQGASQVNTNFEWGPIMSTTFTELGDAFTTASTGNGTLQSALAKTQSQTISAMHQQGFSVKAG
ncbi:MAG: extracellular solute-binding protein, partial [Gallionella sp.]|nr:extracellular solute-binding protein [Gallionella sp.]